MAAGKPKKTKVLKGQINGGEWTFHGIFTLKDGTVVDSTQFTAVYAESNFQSEVKADNVGVLLRGRTREVLQRAAL